VRRAAATGLLLLLVACGGTERPEGIVERWLTSLNQGKAGRPELFAPDELSERVLPNWEHMEPGQLDVIEVGRGSLDESGVYAVPFRVDSIEGSELQAWARVLEGRVAALVRPTDPGRINLPSEGAPPITGGGFVAWLAAVGVATLFILMSIGVMSFVRRRSPT
jgi:hypothetical protein